VLTAAGVLATEAMYYRLAGQQAGVAVPSVLDVDPGGGVVAGGYLVMSECAGSPWPELLPQPARREHDQLRAELGCGNWSCGHLPARLMSGQPTVSGGPSRAGACRGCVLPRCA
jgi:hypothetical protein